MLFFPPRWGPHASRRKRKFTIHEKQIAFTWLFGESHIDRNDCWRLIGEEVTLILDPPQLFIITLFPNRYKDRFIARTVRYRRADGNVRMEWIDGTYSQNQLPRAMATNIQDSVRQAAYIFGAPIPMEEDNVDLVKIAKSFDDEAASHPVPTPRERH